jgi:hypothetical protein
MWSPRMVMSWPDRHPWAAATFAVPATIVDLGDRHPEAAVALAVPATIVGIAAVAAYPFVFLPLLVLVGVAFVVSVIYTGQTEGADQQAQVALVPAKQNRQQGADRARAQAEPNRSRLELEVEAEAAEAEAVAAWARAQVIRLWLDATR